MCIDNLLSEMIEFSRVGAPHYDSIDIQSTLRGELEKFGGEFEEKGIEVRWEEKPQPLVYVTDNSLLRYACRNIIIDSLNKIPQGGFFQFGAGLSDGKRGGPKVRRKALALRVEYPFSLETSKEAKKFFHPKTSLQREFFGLRLTIAKQVATKLGGTLTCEDTLESTTKITLTVSPPEETEKTGDKDGIPSSAHRR